MGCSDRTHCLKAVRPQVRRTALQPWVQPVLERVAQVVRYLPRVQIHFPACLWGHQVQAWGLQSPWAKEGPSARVWVQVWAAAAWAWVEALEAQVWVVQQEQGPAAQAQEGQ